MLDNNSILLTRVDLMVSELNDKSINGVSMRSMHWGRDILSGSIEQETHEKTQKAYVKCMFFGKTHNSSLTWRGELPELVDESSTISFF